MEDHPDWGFLSIFTSLLLFYCSCEAGILLFLPNRSSIAEVRHCSLSIFKETLKFDCDTRDYSPTLLLKWELKSWLQFGDWFEVKTATQLESTVFFCSNAFYMVHLGMKVRLRYWGYSRIPRFSHFSTAELR